MSKEHSFRWGIDILDDGHVPVYLFMLRNYAKADVTRNEFLCILHLAAYHYETESGESRPAQDTIAEEMGYAHRNSVARIIDGLKEKGMLEVEERPGKTSVYNFAPFSRKMYELWKGENEDAHPDVDAHHNVQVDAHGDVQVPATPDVHEEKELKEKEKQEEEVVAASAADDEPPQRGDIISLYGDNIGAITSLIGDDLNDAIDEFGPTVVKEAIEWAVKSNNRNFKSVYGCCCRMVGKETPGDVRKKVRAAAKDAELDAAIEEHNKSHAAYVAHAEKREVARRAKQGPEMVKILGAAKNVVFNPTLQKHLEDATVAFENGKATFTVPDLGALTWLNARAQGIMLSTVKVAGFKDITEIEFVTAEKEASRAA